MPTILETEAQIDAFIEKFQDAKTKYVEQNSSFIEALPKRMQDADILTRLGLGNTTTLHQYQLAEERAHDPKHGDLKEGQHPVVAVISSSHPDGLADNCVGAVDENEPDIGRALMLRVPSTGILTADGEVNLDTKSFLSLAKMKHLDTVFHATTTNSELVDFIYLYGKKFDEQGTLSVWDVLPEEVRNNPYARDYVISRLAAYSRVKDNGLGYYENMLILDPDEKKNRELRDSKLDELSSKEREEIRWKRALTIQLSLWAREDILKVEDRPEHVVSIIKGKIAERTFVYHEESKKYVAVPDGEANTAEYKAFMKMLPEHFTKPPKGQKHSAAEYLIRGTRTYTKALLFRKRALKRGLKFFALYIACSDSRSHPASTLGEGAAQMVYGLRTPGSSLSKDGKLLSTTGRAFAIAQLHHIPVIHATHGVCGAMQLMEAHFTDKEGVTPSFQQLSGARKKLFEKVWNFGVEPNKGERIKIGTTDKEIAAVLNHYKDDYGVNVKTIPDCLAVQQAVDERKIAKAAYKDVVLYTVVQNMSEAKNYLFNPEKGKFVAIPKAEWSFPKVAPRPHPGHIHGHGCC